MLSECRIISQIKYARFHPPTDPHGTNSTAAAASLTRENNNATPRLGAPFPRPPQPERKYRRLPSQSTPSSPVMFKRRDWKFFHNDGGGEDSSSDSDSDLSNDGVGSLSSSRPGALHSSTVQLNLSALHRIGVALRGCVARFEGV
jgi:hypothetical protein